MPLEKTMDIPDGALSVRINRANRNHHLSRNLDGKLWINYTIHCPDYTKHRVRHSLYTRDIQLARQQRDRLLGLV